MRIVDFRCLLMQPRNTEDMDSIFLNINFWSGAFHRPGVQILPSYCSDFAILLCLLKNPLSGGNPI